MAQRSAKGEKRRRDEDGRLQFFPHPLTLHLLRSSSLRNSARPLRLCGERNHETKTQTKTRRLEIRVV